MLFDTDNEASKLRSKVIGPGISCERRYSMNFESLIDQYGYAAILIGTFFEGETILIIAGFLSHQGYLQLAGVIAAAFAGAALGDQLYFYLGRWKGNAFIESHQSFNRHRLKIETILKRNQIWLILGFRFIYGIRTVTPFILGANRVNAGLFFLLNVLGALLWAIVIGLAGFYIGNALEAILGQVKEYELLVISLLASCTVISWTGIMLIRHHRVTRNKQESEDV